MKYDLELRNRAKKYFMNLNPKLPVEHRLKDTCRYLERIENLKVSLSTLWNWYMLWKKELKEIETKAKEIAIKKTSNDLASTYESYFSTAETLLKSMLEDYEKEAIIPKVSDILKLLELIGKMKGYIVERRAVVQKDITEPEELEVNVHIVSTAEEKEFLEWKEKHSESEGEAREQAIVYS